ncbi:MAG: hypothetical protein KatS3mg008_1301 [Acidimicrobiales bacterium]|nr:MAG: hypothetical protein KatS3mg008_1301 [Acidimicrobiales bacterium]
MTDTTVTQPATASADDWVVTVLDLELVCLSGLRISGPSDRDDVDIPVHRDHRGEPLVPGSSLKGVLRSLAERVLRAKDPGLACDVIADPCPKGKKPEEVTEEMLAELCWCCRLFGSHHMGGRAAFGDLTTDSAATVVRDGVGIDRDELKAADKVKFDYEVVVPGSKFTGEVRIEDPEPGDVGLVLGLFDLVEQGAAGLGGGTTRGLGRVSLRCVGARQVRASTWTPGAGWTRLETAQLEADKQAAARRMQTRPGATGGEAGSGEAGSGEQGGPGDG